MTWDDESLKKIVGVLVTADGGCSCCCSSILREFQEKFGVSKPRIKKAIMDLEEIDKPYWAETEKELDEELEYLK